ncbi:MAG: hypothetical protein AAGG38_02160 [Planctomycetota bacterium]
MSMTPGASAPDDGSSAGEEPQTTEADEEVEANFESTVGAALAVANAKDNGLEPDEDGDHKHDDETDPVDEADDAGEDTGDLDDGHESADEPESDAGDDEAVADEPASPLPAAHVRSLKAYDWTDAEIEAGLKADPTGFPAMAAKVHQTRNSELARWAEIGRSRQPPPPPPEVPPDVSAHGQRSSQADLSVADGFPGANLPGAGLPGVKPLDLDALQEKYGDDEQITEVVQTVNTAVERLNKIIPQVETSLNRVQQTEQDALEKTVNAFFSTGELKQYAEVYGPDFGSLTDEQHAARIRVLQTADALSIGAQAQGHNLGVTDALQMAHDMVAGDYKVKVARGSLKAKAKQRQRGITFKPSSKTKRASAPTGEQALEAKVGAKLRALQGNL